MPDASGLQFQHHPLAVDSGNTHHVLAGNEQAVILKPTRIAISAKHADKGRRRRPKARPSHINPILEMRLIPPDSLHLQPEESTRCNVSSEHFDCLEVWKWSGKIERLRLRQSPDDLNFPAEAFASAIYPASKPIFCRRCLSHTHRLEPLRQIAHEVPGAAPTGTCLRHPCGMPPSDTPALA